MIAGLKPKSFAFVIMPGFPMACLTSAIEPLRACNEITGTDHFSWRVVSEAATRTKCSAGVTFDPDIGLAELAGCDALYLLSTPTSAFENERATNGALRSLARRGAILGAFSGGIFPLARSGLLEGRSCSVHWVYETAFAERFPSVSVKEKMVVRDGQLETASGAAAVFDLMLIHVEAAFGRAVATEVACWFQHPFVRGGEAAQLVPTKHMATTQDRLSPPVQKAIALFASHIQDPIRVQDVANQVDLSSRQLDRIFQQETGLGPLSYYLAMRMEKARQMVLYSHQTTGAIALAVGYASPDPLARNYKRAFGVSPSEHRRMARRGAPSQRATMSE